MWSFDTVAQTLLSLVSGLQLFRVISMTLILEWLLTLVILFYTRNQIFFFFYFQVLPCRPVTSITRKERQGGEKEGRGGPRGGEAVVSHAMAVVTEGPACEGQQGHRGPLRCGQS